jgi:hypothetical protein
MSQLEPGATGRKLAVDGDMPVWGAREIGREAGCLNEDGTVDIRKAYNLLAKGRVDADKCGKLWISTRNRIRRSLGTK